MHEAPSQIIFLKKKESFIFIRTHLPNGSGNDSIESDSHYV